MIKIPLNFAMNLGKKRDSNIIPTKKNIRHSVETGSVQFSSQIMFSAWALIGVTSIVIMHTMLVTNFSSEEVDSLFIFFWCRLLQRLMRFSSSSARVIVLKCVSMQAIIVGFLRGCWREILIRPHPSLLYALTHSLPSMSRSREVNTHHSSLKKTRLFLTWA